MKIQQVTIQNFKNLQDVSEDLNGANILLIGENGLGKSSFLQAIEIALGNKNNLPPEPITFDEKNAYIEVITGADGQQWKFEAKFSHKTKQPVLSVTTPDGAKDIRKSLIGEIVGSIDFNIDEFVELSKTVQGKRKQVEIIESFFPEDLQEDLRKHKNNVQMHYEDRTETNREIKTYQGVLKDSDIQPGDFKTYAESVDIETKEKEYEKGLQCNVQREEIEAGIKKRQQEIADGEQWLKDNPVIEIAKLREELEDDRAFNEMCTKVATQKNTREKLDQLNEESGDLTALIESSNQAIEDAIKDFEMPVSGLSFDMDGLLYHGVPVDAASMACSEIIHLGIELKMARNPNVKILCIEHGESLGTERLKQIQEMCEKYDYQIIMEQVSRGEEELKFEIMPKV